MIRARTILLVGLSVLAAACAPAAPAAAPSGSAPGPSSVGSAVATASTIGGSAAPSAGGSVDQLCATVDQLRAALTRLKSMSSASPAADLRAAAHDVGQAGATLIVLKAGAADLTKLNQEAILILGLIDAGQGPADKDLAEFEATAQKVLDELISCP